MPGSERAKAPESPDPIGPTPKEGPRPKGGPQLGDPRKEADRVTALADYRAELEEAQTQLLLDHFRICDLDGNGWLSIREGQLALSLDRSEYKRADKNGDGRLDRKEFVAQRETLLPKLGAIPSSGDSPIELGDSSETAPEPEPEEVETVPDPFFLPPRSELSSMRVMPGDVLRRYDRDRSKGIDAEEIERLFDEIGLALSPELVIAQMDPNDSGQLEVIELIAIAWLTSQRLPEPEEEPSEALASTDEALEPSTPTQRAPQKGMSSPAGLTHFGRLDADGDGFINEADLRTLQSPARIDLRLRAILSAMDLDGDGRLSEGEYYASMNDRPRRP